VDSRHRRRYGYGMTLRRCAHGLMAAVVAAMAIVAVLVGFGTARAKSGIFVGAHADSVVDRSGRWTIADVVGPEGAARFAPADGRRAANYGAANGPHAAIWLRLVIPRDLATDGGLVVLTVRESRIRTLDLYRAHGGGWDVRRWRLGVVPEAARLATRYPTVTLPESARGETVLIRFHTPSSMRASVWVQNEASYLGAYAAEMMFFGLVLGVLAALFVYLASAAIGSRDAAMGALAILALSFIFHILGDQAFLETYLLPGAADLSRIISITATFVIYTASLFYALNVLHTKAEFPRLARILGASVWVLAALTVAAAIATATGFLILRRLSPLIGLATIAAILGLVLATLIRQPRTALLFILCWVPAQATGIARLIPDLVPHDGFNPVLINLFYPAFAASLLLAGIAAASDIRRRENALTLAVSENAERLKAFAESASDSFWETDPSGRIVFASGPACATAGLAVGLAIQSVLEHDGGARLEPGAGLSRAPVLREDADRGLRHLRLSAVPIAEGGWRGIVSDVSDEVMETERTNRQRRLAAIGQMAGGVAHEINNLLHPMINLSRLAGESLEESDGRRRWLEIVHASGMRAAEIVAALLSSVRPIPNDGRRAPLGAALAEIAEELRALVPASAHFETHLETERGPIVPVAEAFQVVANLVTNALYATSGGAVSLSYRLVQGAQGGLFELTVVDDGVGMDEATLRRASEPFFTTKPQGEGTGLGLSIVQGLASKWGAELKITSVLGKGTRVTVSLAAVEQLALHEGDLREDSRG